MLDFAKLETIGITRSLILDLCIYYITVRFFIWVAKPFIFTSPLSHLPGPPPQSWFKGNLGQLFNAKGLPFHQSLVDDYGGMVKVYGFFGDEQLYVSDPKALQSIVLKDQDAYEETDVFIDSNRVVFGPGLVATTGEVHKRQRKLVMPVFSVAQLKALTPLFYDIAEKLSDVLSRESNSQYHHTGKSVLDMNEWMSRVALESVGQAVLNYSFDPLNSAANNPYTEAIKELIPTLFSLALLRQFAPFLSHIGSDSFRRKVVEWMPNRTIQKLKDISDVMHNTAKSILQERRENIRREHGKPDGEAKDIISVLLRENDRAPLEEKMTDKELTGQMTVLIFGAQDTTSSCLSRTLDLLAMNPDIQAKVREEVQAAVAGQDATASSPRLGYDEISALPWLDAVLKETLRLYPPVPFVRRTAVKERTLFYSVSDLGDLESDSSDTTNSVTVPVGTTLFVSIAGANRLESLWGADAKEWKPTRWMLPGGQKANPAARLPGIFAGTLSFLGGGRSCPGYKFALIEMKIILATLLMRFRFSKTDDEIVWNLSQIIAPSVRREFHDSERVVIEEAKGLPLVVGPVWNR
ncbi:cytochrome p450 [Moniliophthora roreri MCA 2997]|uniref:Cytochrome p450 n=1 Tax=Moniliophthora roreri (strain MCA 2997) TaxID=1381753 RepID=V2X6H0_MONRO|nr:cytochrome p450 [Moniliophthora roreri MCA 2997]